MEDNGTILMRYSKMFIATDFCDVFTGDDVEIRVSVLAQLGM